MLSNLSLSIIIAFTCFSIGYTYNRQECKNYNKSCSQHFIFSFLQAHYLQHDVFGYVGSIGNIIYENF
jgi:hypothetical protein